MGRVTEVIVAGFIVVFILVLLIFLKIRRDVAGKIIPWGKPERFLAVFIGFLFLAVIIILKKRRDWQWET
jgi:hypothetical protein